MMKKRNHGQTGGQWMDGIGKRNSFGICIRKEEFQRDQDKARIIKNKTTTMMMMKTKKMCLKKQ